MSILLDALTLPPESLVNMRVAKKVLAEQAGFASGDKRRIHDEIDTCTWVAALKPENTATPSFADDRYEYLEIAIVSLTLRTATKPSRIQELVHRAIPYPVLLLTHSPQGEFLSAAHKRASLGEKNAVVLEELIHTKAGSGQALFLSSIAFGRQPKKNLFALYQGWIACIQANNAAAIGGQYAPAITPKGYAAQRETLAEYERLQAEIASVEAEAKKEKQLPKLIALNDRLKTLREKLIICTESLRFLQ